MKFELKRPCASCPFIKGTDMSLKPGRMQGIVDDIKRDTNVFPCHKTTHSDKISEQACAGALAYGLKHHGLIPVLARISIAYDRLGKTISVQDIRANFDALEEPGKWPTC